MMVFYIEYLERIWEEIKEVVKFKESGSTLTEILNEIRRAAREKGYHFGRTTARDLLIAMIARGKIRAKVSLASGRWKVKVVR